MARYLAVLCVLVIAGCGGVDERRQTAAEAADRFIAAVRNGDMTAACALLSPKARDDLLTEAPDCAEALTSEELTPSPVGEVTVWGDRAQVRTGAGTLFLVETETGWKVVGAGCEPRGENLPYRCAVGG